MSETRLTEAEYDAITEAAAQWCMRLHEPDCTDQERAYTRGQLLDQVWGGNVYVEERTVDVHIRRLRKALGEAYENLVQTVRGTGYRFSTKA